MCRVIRLFIMLAVACLVLPAAAQARIKEIAQELAACHTAFGQNVLHDESAWSLVLHDEEEMAGLPEFVR